MNRDRKLKQAGGIVSRSEKAPLNRLKTSLWGRSLALAKLSIHSGAGFAGHALSSLLTDDQQKAEKWKVFLKEQAGVISQELGELKGSLMKAGQILSMYGEHFLPAEANELLKTLQSQSTPVAWEQIYEILQQELAEKLDEFEFDSNSIGCASLGQVHKAWHKPTQSWKAVKVQYPGVAKTIDSDLLALKSFLSVLKLLPSNLRTEHLFAEVRDMLLQEMDYEQEAQQTIAYRERLKDDPRYVVPEVDLRCSTKKVLVTSYEPGFSADSVEVQKLGQGERNQLAIHFLDLYLRELFVWGIVQTDPHLGNYKIRLHENAPAQLVLLDFGAVRSYPMEFREPYNRMISAALHNNRAELKKAALELKFIQDGDSEKLRTLFEDFCLGTVEPFLTSEDARHNPEFLNMKEEYDWKRSDLPKRLTKIAFSIVSQFQLRAPPREILFLDRKTGGVFVFLSVLRAQIRGRDLLNTYLK